MNNHGFSLLELMASLGIVGLLSSVAIPTYQTMIIKVKAAERESIMSAIEHDLLAKINADETLPQRVGNASWMFGPSNPIGAESPAKRNWQIGFGDWDFVFEPTSAVYYTYGAQAWHDPGINSWILVWAQSDLDADGIIAYHDVWWTRVGNSPWVRTDTSPPPGIY